MAHSSPNYYEQLSQQLREIRRARGLSQKALMQLIGKSNASHLAKIERDIRKGSLPTVVNILDALNHQLAIVPRRSASVRLDARFVAEVLTNLKSVLEMSRLDAHLSPLTDLEGADFSRRMFGLLMGASYCALKSAEILGTDFAPQAWDPAKLVDALESSIKEHDIITFDHSKDLTLWVFGMYLNKLQSNLRVALSQCVHTWLRLRHPQYRADPPANLLTDSLIIQVEALTGHVVAQEAQQQLPEFLADMKAVHHPESLLGHIESCRRLIPATATALSWAEIQTLLNDDRIPPRESVAIVIHHSEFFERGMIAPSRRELTYVIEWVMSIKAMLWIGELFRMLREDIAPRP